MQTAAILPEDDGAGRSPPDKNGDEQDQGRRANEKRKRSHYIEYPLCHQFPGDGWGRAVNQQRLARKLIELGFSIVATRRTRSHFLAEGIDAECINKVAEGQPHIVDAMIEGKIHLVINTTEGAQAIADSFSLRRTALTNSIPYYTTVAGARAAVAAIEALRRGALEVAPLQSYLSGSV